MSVLFRVTMINENCIHLRFQLPDNYVIRIRESGYMIYYLNSAGWVVTHPCQSVV